MDEYYAVHPNTKPNFIYIPDTGGWEEIDKSAKYYEAKEYKSEKSRSGYFLELVYMVSKCLIVLSMFDDFGGKMSQKIVTNVKSTERGIQFLRILACVGVFICHFGQRLHLERWSINLYNFTQLGRYGVELFFVISGYLVCFSLSKKQTVLQFYKMRAILYYLYISLAFCVILLQKHLSFDMFHLILMGWVGRDISFV